MTWPPITKDLSAWPVRPNLTDLEQVRVAFDWEQVRNELSDGADSVNIGELAVDRQVAGPLRDRIALRWLGRDGAIVDTSFAQLRDQTNRFANVLRALGIGKQDRVFALAGRIPALYVAALGTLKEHERILSHVLGFGPEPVHQRMQRGTRKFWSLPRGSTGAPLPTCARVSRTAIRVDCRCACGY